MSQERKLLELKEKIEKAIAAAGYDANETKRDKKAYARLPKCCQ